MSISGHHSAGADGKCLYCRPKAEAPRDCAPKPKAECPKARYRRADRLDVAQVMELCARGKDNRAVAREVGIGPQAVYGIRMRRPDVAHLWPTIDEWKRRNA